jgi:hypothetical protein
MKWTYDDYQQQPAWFITMLLLMLKEESAEFKRRNPQQN